MRDKTTMAMVTNRGARLEQPEPVKCSIKPECKGCTFPSHGFICWSADGSCMADRFRKKPPDPEGADVCPV